MGGAPSAAEPGARFPTSSDGAATSADSECQREKKHPGPFDRGCLRFDPLERKRLQAAPPASIVSAGTGSLAIGGVGELPEELVVEIVPEPVDAAVGEPGEASATAGQAVATGVLEEADGLAHAVLAGRGPSSTGRRLRVTSLDAFQRGVRRRVAP